MRPSMAVRADILSALPPPVLTSTHHRCSRSHALAATATSTSTTIRWSRQRRNQDPLPPLFQRPHHPSPTKDQHLLLLLSEPVQTIGDSHKDDEYHDDDEEEEDSIRCVTATAADVLCLMDSLRLPVQADIYISLVKECTDAKDAEQGVKVHAHIQQNSGGVLSGPSGLLLANRLLLMYAACGQSDNARNLFDEMRVRDSISWATMIIGGSLGNAVKLFVAGLLTGELGGCCFVAAITAVLRACHWTGELGFGQQIHGLILKMAVDGEHYLQLGSPLIQFYTTVGYYRSAQKVFDRMLSHDAAAWACMITACCRDGRFKEAFYWFREMGKAGGRKNRYTFSGILPACARMDYDGCSGRQVHSHAIKLGVDFDPFVGSSLVDMYAKHGFLGDARRAFQTTISSNGSGDTVCWNAMFSGYAQKGFCTEAISILYEMKAAGIRPHELMLDQVRKLVS